MDSDFCSDKYQILLEHIIEIFCLDKLPFNETLGIKVSLSVFTDNQLVFSTNLDEDYQKTEKSSKKAFDVPKNPVEGRSEDQSTFGHEKMEAYSIKSTLTGSADA